MIDEQSRDNACKVMVCAMSADAIRGGIPTLIRTYRVAANQGPDCTIVEAVRATTATPGMFKRVWIEEQTVKTGYVGGALGCNNTAAHAISEVEMVFPGRSICTILSVGSGQLHSASIPARRRLSRFLPSNVTHTFNSIATDCERTNQELCHRFRYRSNAYFRFNAEHGPEDIDQLDLVRLSEVRAHTQTYLKDAVVTANLDNALALKFVQSHKDTFFDVFYVDATTRETISAGLTSLAKAAEAGTTPEEALAWLVSQEKRWLLVLNNADDPELNLHEFFPVCAHGDILITTRNQQMIVHAVGPESHCRVSGMRPNDAFELLLKTSGADSEGERASLAKELIKELGYFALAIVQSGAYMRARQCGISEYFRIFQTARARLLRERPSKQMGNYQLSVFATWEISYRQLLPRSIQLLHIISFMHHEGISEAFFEAANARAISYELLIPLTESQRATQAIIFDFLSSLRSSSNEWDALRLKDLTDQLRAFSLLDYDTQSSSYSLHPLVQEWSRTTTADGANVRECAAWVLSLCVNWEQSLHDYAFRRRLLPHLLALNSEDTQMVPEIARNLEMVYYEAGYAKEEEALMAITLQASKDTLGNNHPTTLTRMHNLAAALRSQEKLEEAEALLVEVIEVRKPLLGHEHPHTLTSMHVLAMVYRDQKRWQEAEVLFLQVVGAQKRVSGAEHSHTLISMGMLASTYWSQGRLSEAEALYVEVFETAKKALGREHPDTLLAMHNLAMTYQQQGRLPEAESLMQETVALSKQVRGEFHVETQKSLR
ncbi:TPR-like protein, partial [Ceratobasidium sp. AG-I]